MFSNKSKSEADSKLDKKTGVKDVVSSLGLVFGDIGTSPIYTLTVVFLLVPHTLPNIIGILSLIFWTITMLVSVQYTFLAMSLGKKGEGGTIVLRELLVPMVKSSRQLLFISLVTFVGISLLIGDGVITPAISILSAVEGILLIPGLENTSQSTLIFIAALIAVALFSFQRKGTEKVAGAFGPLMILWFVILGLSGLAAIISTPSVLIAVNPYYGIKFILTHGLPGFFILSSIILCATGGEALYADMGHLGRKPIEIAWRFVVVALVLNYFGQGAFLEHHPSAKNLLFEMIFSQARCFYVPFLILSIIATVIASQAMISGMFSIVYQGITTRIMPLFKVDYTSPKLRSQIYIGAVNTFLLIFVVLIMFNFKESKNLAAAYGLAVTGTMTITGILMAWIFHLRNKPFKMMLSVLITIIDLIFLLANTSKLHQGGYWSILIALIPFLIIMIYTSGQKRLYKSLKLMDLDVFLQKYREFYNTNSKIEGTALFFARGIGKVPPYVTNTMFTNKILYSDNIFVSINTLDEPFGVDACFKENLAEGLRVFEIRAGYLEVVDVESILSQHGIYEQVIFYGMEEIVTDNLIWRIFAIIKKITPSFVQFYKLPPNKLHGVITRLEM